ncbi:ribosomal-protein-alanine N-acetyltransferase [Chitinivorax tropicus]|uniref:Ribosomal-protein-alanine N-acetyltransferase n=1 Tax=Chitinivorax tropicus TaxID=714531 RepID=A0A840MFH9_9PROT|nr:GNAT family N-acetyltransferase [Chitinivorax tropicus]MBB5018014.1 ribosomal-protein-alanine N-acetyltransferase [Chitinivorax tropicus]
MKQPPVLRDEGLTLRMANDSDIHTLVEFYQRNQAFLQPFSPPWPDSMLELEAWPARLTSQWDEFLQGRGCKLYVFDGRQVIGSIGISGIQRGPFQACFIGYELDEHAQGKGIATRAVRLVVDYAFTELGMHRVQANYMPTNERSGNLLRRLGFTVEGYARDYLYINGKWADHILTSLTNTNMLKP